jgi:SAM-dependent methyltransferase
VIRCPECMRSMRASEGRCRCGAAVRDDAGVLRLVPVPERDELGRFVAAFHRWRCAQGLRPIARESLERLPETPPGGDDALWRLRREDLQLVRSHIHGAECCRVLDFGAWNGWLSNRIAGDGHSVLATDVFVDEIDGLGAYGLYRTPKWIAAQVDPRRLDVLEGPFDVIVLNRNFSTLPEVPKVLDSLAGLVADAGSIVITGVTVYRLDRRIRRHFDRLQTELQSAGAVCPWGFRGWATMDDLRMLERRGFQVLRSPGSRLSRMMKTLHPGRPIQYNAVWKSQ